MLIATLVLQTTTDQLALVCILSLRKLKYCGNIEVVGSNPIKEFCFFIYFEKIIANLYLQTVLLAAHATATEHVILQADVIAMLALLLRIATLARQTTTVQTAYVRLPLLILH